jgi:hypothetical protein
VYVSIWNTDGKPVTLPFEAIQSGLPAYLIPQLVGSWQEVLDALVDTYDGDPLLLGCRARTLEQLDRAEARKDQVCRRVLDSLVQDDDPDQAAS